MRADMQAMYGCSRGMIAEQRVRAAAARISFLHHELDEKGGKKVLENNEKLGLCLVRPFYELLRDAYERSGMGFVPYLPVLMEKIRKKAGYPSSAQRMRCPDTAGAIGVPIKKRT